VRADAEYVITRKLGHRVYADPVPKPEYYYRVMRGSRKVCEVWGEGTVRKFYDKQGKIARMPDAYRPTSMIHGSRGALARLILHDAFDWATALEWASDVAVLLRLPMQNMEPRPKHVVYQKSELFELILEARKARVAP
jgi:hypothetical protein